MLPRTTTLLLLASVTAARRKASSAPAAVRRVQKKRISSMKPAPSGKKKEEDDDKWDAANAKALGGSEPVGLARTMHAMWGLDHYPKYLERWAVDEISELEAELERTLAKVREQKAARIASELQAQPLSAGSVRVDEVLTPGIVAALGWAPADTMAQALGGSAKKKRPDARWLALLREESDDVYSLDLFRPDFCERVACAVDATQRGDMAKNFPRANLDLMGMGWISDLLLYVTEALASRLYGTETGLIAQRRAPLDWRHAYVLKYEPKHQGENSRSSLVSHTDDSEITLNVALGREFEGGELLMGGVRGTDGELQPLHQAASPDSRAPGRALLHLGRHLHAVSPVEFGERRVLICWCRSLNGVRSQVCPCCWMNRRHHGQSGDCITGPKWN